MDGGRKLPGGEQSPSGNYRRIIPPLNDTDSDSSLEYWEEKNGATATDTYSPRTMKVKKERVEDEDEETCCQRMVYKIKPIDQQSGTRRENGAGPSGIGSGGSQFLPSPRRAPFMNLEDVALSEREVDQRQLQRMSDPRVVKKRQQATQNEDTQAGLQTPPSSAVPPRTVLDHSYATSSNGRQRAASLSPPASQPSGSQDTSVSTLVQRAIEGEPSPKRPRLGEEGTRLNSNILSMIECPVCLEYMGPPIHQCRRGHLVCNSCRAQLVNCPTCRSRFTDLRNLVLERIVEMIKYPCKHDSCGEMHLLKDKNLHELNCLHRRYTCMAQGCDWRGVHSSLVPHVKSQHSGLIHDGNHLIISFPIQMLANSSRNYVLHAFNEMFRVNFQRGPGTSLVHGVVIYLGPIDNAKNFTFQFKMEKEKEGVERGMTFKRTVLSDEHKPSNYYNKSEAFSATVDMLRLIATSKGKVHVDVLIERKVHKREEANNPSTSNNSPDSNDEEDK